MSQSNDDWVEPQSIDEANERRADLVARVQRMQGQLGGSRDERPEVRAMSAREYRGWRGRTIHALSAKQDELRRINTWLKSNGKREKGTPKVRVLPSDDRSPVDTVRKLQVYTGKLFSLYLAVGNFLDNDTDEAFDELVRTFQLAEQVIPHRNEPSQFED
jgi:hypothetical protein